MALMNNLAQIVFYSIILLMLMLQSQSLAQSSIKVGRSVIAGGGGKSTTSIYSSSGTIGQASTGRATTSIYKLGSGFWSGPFTGSCCIGNRGDLNADGVDADILDLTFAIDRIFRGGVPSGCPAEADVNADGILLNVIDLTFLVDRIFRRGVSPAACP